MATKALLGVRLYEAYQEGDKQALSDLAYSRIAEARQAIAKLCAPLRALAGDVYG